MRNNFLKFLVLFLFIQVSPLYASSAPIKDGDVNQILENENQNIKVQKDEKNKEDKEAKKDRKEKKDNIIVLAPNDKILSESKRKINAIYPRDLVRVTNSYPGYRGSNQLVIYVRSFGKNTNTNEFGKEAVVVDGIVTELTGANTTIPRNGFVISGHGSAKKWISDNLKIGTKIEIEDDIIKAYTTLDSYRYCAKHKIKMVEDILISTKSDYALREDKQIYYYLKKAKQQYKKSLRNNSDDALECAKESIKNSTMVFRYSLPYLEDELKGTWIRPKETSSREIQKTLDRIKQTGINNVFLETYFHGQTIFPSRVMESYNFTSQNPKFAGFDPLAIWVSEAHKRKMKVHVWFESFYIGNTSPETNPSSILAVKPTWQNRTKQKYDYKGYVLHPQEHNGYFLDPANPEVIKYLTSLIGEITARYDIDGINIDYVRYPNISKDNKSNQWGYTPFAREEFLKTYEIDPMDIEYNSSDWDNWCQYRKDKITDYIKKVSELAKNRNITLSAVIFPDYKISVLTKFQDWDNWLDNGYLDAITPLILTSDDALAKNMLEEIKRKSKENTKVYPGLFAGFTEADPEDLLKQIHIIRKLKLNGVVLFDWAHLNKEYLDVLKTSVFKVQTY